MRTTLFDLPVQSLAGVPSMAPAVVVIDWPHWPAQALQDCCSGVHQELVGPKWSLAMVIDLACQLNCHSELHQELLGPRHCCWEVHWELMGLKGNQALRHWQ